MDTVAASSVTRPSAMSSRFTIPGEPPRSATVNAPRRPGCAPVFGMPADLAVERALIDQRAHHRGQRVVAFQDLLPGQPPGQPLNDHVLSDIGVCLQDRPRVRLGLEQARNQTVLKDVQRRRFRLVRREGPERCGKRQPRLHLLPVPAQLGQPHVPRL